MGELLGNWKRTQYCAEVGEGHIGQQVTLMGWAQRRRDLGNLIFVWLRDRTGIVQVVFSDASPEEVFQKGNLIRSEFVVAVKGVVAARTPENINPQLPTGTIEVIAEDVKILSEAETPPFNHEDENVSDALRLKYRYLDLRRPWVQRVLTMKHAVSRSVREFLDGEGFVDLETPILTKSTPEGARDYLVPSRVHPGKFFALPQSPQLFKQLLMVSGFDKYYQIAKCFRDEDLRADRQPEFTQIDIEMSFVDVEDVLDIGERMFVKVFKDVLDHDLPAHFPRLTYREAMDRFGSDKPDMRFGMELMDITEKVEHSGFKVFADTAASGGKVIAVNAEVAASKYSRKDLDRLGEYVKTYHAKGLAYVLWDETGEMRSPIGKFMAPGEMEGLLEACGAKPGDALFFVADKSSVALTACGQLRLLLGKELGLIDASKFAFLWVTEFPMFEYDEESGRYNAQHHPFCSPMDEDIPYLETDLGKVRAKAYDIVLNGTELASGSIRIHSADVQEKIFRCLGFSKEQAWDRFGFLLDAFRYGPPPHGGIAPGLDRVVMLMAGCESIRDTIAFPKVQSAACLMTDAPDYVEEKQLKELSIKSLESSHA